MIRNARVALFWPAWRIVKAGWATWPEMHTTWSVHMVVDANAALDELDAAEQFFAKR